MLIVFALLNAISVATSDVLGGVATRRLPLTHVLLIATPAALVVSTCAAVAEGRQVTASGLFVGLAAGLVGGAGLAIAYRAFAVGPVGVVAAVIACSGMAVMSVGGVVLGEPLTDQRALALVLCTFAVALVSLSGHSRTGLIPLSRAPLLAGLAGSAFAGFALVLQAAPEDDGWWPLVGARLGIVVVTVLLLAVTSRRAKQPSMTDLQPPQLVLPLGAGIVDVVGNVFLVKALQAGDLVTVAVVAACAPALTAILGWAFLRERLLPWQLVGLLASVVAVALGAS